MKKKQIATAYHEAGHIFLSYKKKRGFTFGTIDLELTTDDVLGFVR